MPERESLWTCLLTRLSRDFYGMGQFGGNGGEGRWDEWDDFSVALWIRVESEDTLGSGKPQI